MSTSGGRRRRNGMNPQLVSDAFYTFNVDIVHECSPLYAAKSKRKVEIIQQKLTGRILSAPPTAAPSLFSLSPSDGERAGVRGRARPCCQRVFPLSHPMGEGRGEGPSFLRPVVLTSYALRQKLTIRRALPLGRSSVRTARESGWKRQVDYQEEHISVPFRLRPCRGVWLILLTDMYYPAESYFGNT